MGILDALLSSDPRTSRIRQGILQQIGPMAGKRPVAPSFGEIAAGVVAGKRQGEKDYLQDEFTKWKMAEMKSPQTQFLGGPGVGITAVTTEKIPNDMGGFGREITSEVIQEPPIKPVVKDQSVTFDDLTTMYPDLDPTSKEFKDLFEMHKKLGQQQNIFNMGDKVDYAKEISAIGLVEDDIEKFKGATANKVAVEQMQSAMKGFKTGSLADIRTGAGQFLDLIGFTSKDQSDLTSPADSEVFTAASNKLTRQLASGLQNLNRQELIMLKKNYPRLSNTREGNELLTNILKKEYETQEKINQAAVEYYSDTSDESFKNYQDKKAVLLNQYSTDVRDVLNDFTEALDKFDSLKKQVMGQSGPGVDLRGNPVEIVVEKTDKFIQLDPLDGMPVYEKQGGFTYKIRDED